MTIELTDQEANLILQLLHNTPVSLTPQNMPGYLAMVQGIAGKLQDKEEDHGAA